MISKIWHLRAEEAQRPNLYDMPLSYRTLRTYIRAWSRTSLISVNGEIATQGNPLYFAGLAPKIRPHNSLATWSKLRVLDEFHEISLGYNLHKGLWRVNIPFTNTRTISEIITVQCVIWIAMSSKLRLAVRQSNATGLFYWMYWLFVYFYLTTCQLADRDKGARCTN